MKINTYCDCCYELLDENNSCVIFKHMAFDTLVFCSDDCLDSFVKEHTLDAHIDTYGTIIED